MHGVYGFQVEYLAKVLEGLPGRARPGLRTFGIGQIHIAQHVVFNVRYGLHQFGDLCAAAAAAN